VTNLDEAGVRAHLEQQGFPGSAAAQYAASFDWTKPVYSARLEPGDRIVQLVRNPWAGEVEGRAFDSAFAVGNFFALRGASSSGLAIGSGLSGRRRVAFEVLREILVVEGTAGPFATPFPAASIGGPGGATQIVVSNAQKFSLRALN